MERANESPIWAAVHALSVNPIIQASLSGPEFLLYIEAISALAERIDAKGGPIVSLDPLLDEVMTEFPNLPWDKVIDQPQTLKGVTLFTFNFVIDMDEILAKAGVDPDSDKVPTVGYLVRGRILSRLPDPESGSN